LVGTPEGKGEFEKSRHSRKGKAKMNPEGNGSKVVEWIHQADGRDNRQADVKEVMNFRVS
jgi:hypothetical protein